MLVAVKKGRHFTAHLAEPGKPGEGWRCC